MIRSRTSSCARKSPIQAARKSRWIAVLYSAVSLVPIGPEGAQDRSARDALALAQGGLSPLLALEIASTGRSATNRDGAARADPADEHREPALGCAPHPRRTTQAR